MAYGYNYRGAAGYGEGVDPLAAAVQSALATGMAVYSMRKESQEAARRARLDEADRGFRREQFKYSKEQDAQTRAERERARNDAMAREAAERGLTFLPSGGVFGGAGGGRFQRTGLTRIEREATERAGIEERLGRPDLEASARALGIDPGLSSPDLRVAIRSALGQQAGAAKDAASKRDFEEQRRLRQTPTYSDLHPRPQQSDTPAFLRDNAIGQRAATLTQPFYQSGIEVAAGMAPDEAAAAARTDVGNQRQAAFNAERAELLALYKRAFDNFADDPAKQEEATRAFMAAQQSLLKKFRIGGP